MDPDRPVLVDKYLDRADELDVDALAGEGGGARRKGMGRELARGRQQAGRRKGCNHGCTGPFRDWGHWLTHLYVHHL